MFSHWEELEKLSPVQNGRWDKDRLYEYLVQSCCMTFQEELNRFFHQYEQDRQLAGLLLDFLLDEDYDGSDSQMGRRSTCPAWTGLCFGKRRTGCFWPRPTRWTGNGPFPMRASFPGWNRRRS